MDTSLIPRIIVFAKRKNKTQKTVNIYCKISWENQNAEKSLGIKCEVQDWDTNTNSIKGKPVITSELKKKVEKLNQKLLGAYYILKDNSEEIHLDELVDMAFNDAKPKAFTFYKAFEDLIGRLEKSKDSNSKTNIQKHNNCLSHLKKYVKSKNGWKDFPFSKINKLFIEGFVDYLRNDAKCSHNTAMKILAIFKKVYKIGLDTAWEKIMHLPITGCVSLK
jgi:hypothetical protein